MSRNRTLRKLLGDLRLVAARATVRNIVDKKLLSSDIEEIDHIRELFDEYSIRLLLTWLATRYGFFGNQSDMDRDFHSRFMKTEALLMTTGAYPYLTDLSVCRLASDLSTVMERLTDRFGASIELIGLMHEHIDSFSLEIEASNLEDIQLAGRTRYKRRSKGQFYTPPEIVRYGLFAGLKKDSQNLGQENYFQTRISENLKVMDPACGTGNFLTGLLRFADEQGLGVGSLESLAKEGLHGIDLDGKAVCLARFSIILELVRLIGWPKIESQFDMIYRCLRKNLIVADSTLLALENGSEPGSFDLVVTNPPYISFGARNQAKITTTTASLLRHCYPYSSEYKIRLSSLFQEIAIGFARPGGDVVLLVPDGFLTGRRYSRLRGGILRNTTIRSLTEFPDDIISNATVGRWCLAVYRVHPGESGSQSTDVATPPDQMVELATFCEPGEKPVRYEISLANLVTSDHSRLQLLFNRQDEELMIRLACLPRLKTLLRGHTGMRARTGQATIVADRKLGSTWQKGIDSGSQVTAYSSVWNNKWLNVEARHLYSGGFDRQVIANPKILVRQTADRIVAAVDCSGLYHLNNVHSFSGQKIKAGGATRIDGLFELAALMNSMLWAYIYRLKTRESGRVLAQIDIETVEEMPVPPGRIGPGWGEGIGDEISSLSREAHSLMGRPASNLEQLDRITAALDRLVYEAYGLSDEEIDHVEKTVGGLSDLRQIARHIPASS